ncbi:hypothetical protein [Prochlorococcus sp. MIT 1341]|uniref:hypothetical protein n=1 Tax=Prochlorococcus sp. MIT 1341 TaxID=3096221 RepID=UPI002A7483D9|nr:hypothetical protein [Prochlorococcus sp. MIT 1341]
MSKGVADSSNFIELIDRLEQDRAWLLEQIDSGRWPELRLDLAALERELGQILVKVAQKLEDRKDLKKDS